MEIVNKYLRFFLMSVACIISLVITVSGQGYKHIIPLQSNCEDIKLNLIVNNCSYPVSVYEFEDYKVYVWFTKESPGKNDKICWRVPPGTVRQIMVSYKTPILLSKFETRLTLSKEPMDDISAIVYENEDKSIKAQVINDSITQIFYLPTSFDSKKLSYDCRSPEAGDDFKVPVEWFERYWKTSNKNETQILVQTIKFFKKSPLNKEVYIVYYYKNEDDKKEGVARANQAKKYLEKNGMESQLIKVFNGGKKEKSEIVIYIYK